MAKVIWLTGISGAGKTTLGKKVQHYLETRHAHAEFLDGNIVRDFFENDLGFKREDRISNIKRITFAAHLLVKNNIYVVVANIAPYFEARDFIRKKLKDSYIQIYLKASLAKVMERDVWGHYKKYKDGQMKNLAGVDDVYEEPRHPDLVINTDLETEEKSYAQVEEYLKERGI